MYKIHQIFYDDSTRNNLDPGYVPLDNSFSLKPDWFEFYPILSYLQTNKLDENTWYGFLSPKFYQKTGYSSSFVKKTLMNHPDAEVALFSHSWDQIAYFKNPWEQGDFFHPGLLEESQKFINHINLNLVIKDLVCDATNTVFSNFIVAKKSYWDKWITLASKLIEYAERYTDGENLLSSTKYGSSVQDYQMKVFIQERIASIVLYQNRFKTLVANNSMRTGVFQNLFTNDEKSIRLIKLCGEIKSIYRLSNDPAILDLYHTTKKIIPTKNMNVL